MYAIEKVCSKNLDQLISLVVEFAWDAEFIRVAESGGSLLVDFGDPLEMKALARLAKKCEHDVKSANPTDIEAVTSWILFLPHSPEED